MITRARTYCVLLFGFAALGCQSPPAPPDVAHLSAGSDNTVEFFGIRDHGRRVVFITCMDLSYSAVISHELRKAIGSLGPDQSVNVLFLYGGDFQPYSKTGLVPVTAENRRRIDQDLDSVATTGTSDELSAFRFALDEKPDVIYWIDNGDFNGDVREAVNSVRDWNREVRAHIHAIGIVSSPQDVEFTRTLREVAGQNQGVYKTMDRETAP